VANVYVDIALLAENMGTEATTSMNSAHDVSLDSHTTDSDPTDTEATQVVSLAGNFKFSWS
jgi:hypothetical protein